MLAPAHRYPTPASRLPCTIALLVVVAAVVVVGVVVVVLRVPRVTWAPPWPPTCR